MKPHDPWKHRRRIVYGTLTFCALIIAYLAFLAPSDPLREQLSLGLIGLAGATIGSYVFGAVWDDRNIRNRPRHRHEALEEPDDRPKEADE